METVDQSLSSITCPYTDCTLCANGDILAWGVAEAISQGVDLLAMIRMLQIS